MTWQWEGRRCARCECPWARSWQHFTGEQLRPAPGRHGKCLQAASHHLAGHLPPPRPHAQRPGRLTEFYYGTASTSTHSLPSGAPPDGRPAGVHVALLLPALQPRRHSPLSQVSEYRLLLLPRMSNRPSRTPLLYIIHLRDL